MSMFDQLEQIVKEDMKKVVEGIEEKPKKVAEEVLEELEDAAVKYHKSPDGYDITTIPTFDEIKEDISCGSILMCSGTAAESRLIQRVEGTDFSHAATIIRYEGDDSFYLWTADTVDKMEDQIQKLDDVYHSGTHLLMLEEYMANLDSYYPSPDGSKYRFAVGRLSGVVVDYAKLKAVLHEFDGTPFPTTEEEFTNYGKGKLGIDAGMDTAFCGQMLSNTYKHMGWMGDDHPPNYYGPGSFAETDRVNKSLIGGAKIGPPVYFKP